MVDRTAILVALAASLAVATAHAAQPPAQSTKQREICRGGGTRTLGSHIRSTRRCRTAQQWQEEEEAKGRVPVSLQVTQGQNDGQPVRQPQ